jgi:outer membrane protein W
MNTLRIALAAVARTCRHARARPIRRQLDRRHRRPQRRPKSDNGTLTATPLGNLKMDVGSNVRPTITGEYFVRDNLGVEVLAALPFQHDISVVGRGQGRLHQAPAADGLAAVPLRPGQGEARSSASA